MQSGNSAAQQLFQITVHERTPQDNALPNADGDTDIVILSPSSLRDTGKSVVRITPLRSDVTVLAIDLHTLLDSSGDGDPKNDDDTRNTLLREDRNPLHVWFTGAPKRDIRIGALFENGSTYFQSIDIYRDPTPRDTLPEAPEEEENEEETETQEPFSLGNDQIVVLRSDNGTLQFELQMEEDVPEKPILLQWDFGDGTQSLLDQPIHTFHEGGTYTVSVQMRDLHTGRVIREARDDIVVNRLREDPAEREEEPPLEKDEPRETKKETSSGGNILWTIIKVLLIFIITAGVGGLIAFIVFKMKSSDFSMEKTLEDAEKSIVGEPGTEAPPMEVVSDTPPVPEEGVSADTSPPVVDVEPVSPAEPQAQPPEPVASAPQPTHDPMAPDPSQLQPDTENAPSWLQGGLDQTASDGQTVPAQAPEPGVVEPISQAPAPAEEAPAGPPPGTEAPDAPSWLSGDGEGTTPGATSTPVSEPMQVAEPAPEPVAPEPVPEPQAAQEPTPKSTEPDWLAGGDAAASPTPPAPAEPTEPAANVSHDAMQPSTEQLKTNEDNAPDWLQDGIAKAEAEGQTPMTPAPEPLATQPPAPTPEPQAPEPVSEAPAGTPMGSSTGDDGAERQAGATDPAHTPPQPTEPVAFTAGENVAPPVEQPEPPPPGEGNQTQGDADLPDWLTS